MITVLVDRHVYRQVAATLSTRRQWMDFARKDPREVQVWETMSRRSWRLA